MICNMTKGRNTIVLGARISDLMYDAISLIADKKGMTMSECARDILKQDLEVQVFMLEIRKMRSMLWEDFIGSLDKD